MFWATNIGNETLVKLLLGRGADSTLKDGFDEPTPFALAAWHGLEAIIRILLFNGNADIEVNDRYVRKPLWVARNGHQAVFKLLLDRGADVNKKNHTGVTPLLLTAKKGYKTVVSYYLTGALMQGAQIEIV